MQTTSILGGLLPTIGVLNRAHLNIHSRKVSNSSAKKNSQSLGLASKTIPQHNFEVLVISSQPKEKFPDSLHKMGYQFPDSPPPTYIKWTSLNGDAWGATWQGCCWRDAHFNMWWNFSTTQSWDPRVPFTTVNSHNPEGQPPTPRAALVNAIAWNTESQMSLTPDRSRLRAKSRVFTSQRCLLNLSSRDQLHSGHVNLFQELRYFILAIALEQDGGSGEPSLQVKFPQGSCSPWRT